MIIWISKAVAPNCFCFVNEFIKGHWFELKNSVKIKIYFLYLLHGLYKHFKNYQQIPIICAYLFIHGSSSEPFLLLLMNFFNVKYIDLSHRTGGTLKFAFNGSHKILNKSTKDSYHLCAKLFIHGSSSESFLLLLMNFETVKYIDLKHIISATLKFTFCICCMD